VRLGKLQSQLVAEASKPSNPSKPLAAAPPATVGGGGDDDDDDNGDSNAGSGDCENGEGRSDSLAVIGELLDDITKCKREIASLAEDTGTHY